MAECVEIRSHRVARSDHILARSEHFLNPAARSVLLSQHHQQRPWLD
jgi:hypothetical protein